MYMYSPFSLIPPSLFPDVPSLRPHSHSQDIADLAQECKEGEEQIAESVASRRLGRKVESMLGAIDQRLGVLEKDYVTNTSEETQGENVTINMYVPYICLSTVYVYVLYIIRVYVCTICTLYVYVYAYCVVYIHVHVLGIVSVYSILIRVLLILARLNVFYD